MTTRLPTKILTLSVIICSGIAVILFTLFFLDIIPLSIVLGWILGAVITVINYSSIIFQASRLKARIKANIKTPYTGRGYALARFVLSGLGMLICVLATSNNQEIFNLFSLFAAYLVIPGVIYITGAQFKGQSS